MITTSWTKAGNEKEQQETERLPGDTDTEFEAMHFSAAKEKLKTYPPLDDFPLVTKWDTGPNETQQIGTAREPGETVKQWVERHVIEVEAFMAAFPPA